MTKILNTCESPTPNFFKRLTFWKIIGFSIAILAWAGDAFFGWQSNIGYYFLGAIASWCVSDNGA